MITQQQTQRQRLKILPQQIQLLNLYFLNSLELEQRMVHELEENPFMEMSTEENVQEGENKPDKDAIQDFQDWEEYGYSDNPDYRQEYQNYFDSEVAPKMALAGTSYFKDDLLQQLHTTEVAANDLEVAEYLIEALNDHGLMDRDMDELADDISFHLQRMVELPEIERGLANIQRLEPIGIGATSVQQCLQLQLEHGHFSAPESGLALRLIRDHYPDLMHRQFEKIQHSLNMDNATLRRVISFVGNLSFYPIKESGASIAPKNTIIPDFIISRSGDRIQVQLLQVRAHSVYVNQSLFDQLVAQTGTNNRSALQYARSKLQSAQWFVSAVKQREDTMMRIMQCIVSLQEDYFMEGDIQQLKPMVLRIVAEKSGYDISTVSRITSNKYAETHFGIVYLKDLFSEGIADQKGEVISNKVIQSVIEEAIEHEDKHKPYTDQQIVTILSKQGFNIARRTVAKYRDLLHIPIAQIRAVRA
ncbi:MAG: RNA polymerase factor sigma-54 [Bacteroidetes bacterium]|nr:RNA polymerase factor sigma-54 [Bacteroidota bacterium]MBS1629915.1 RNA polymerase factor sigma-54 [Bacteroidota bacterium]